VSGATPIRNHRRNIAGFESWLLVVWAGALMVLVNFKLVNLVRETTRGGQLVKLTPDAFWFGRPTILLWMIKSINFLLGFAIGNACYFGQCGCCTVQWPRSLLSCLRQLPAGPSFG
jgi:hypothetical protein